MGPRDERLGEDSGEQRAVHLDHVRQVEVDRLVQRLLDRRVRAAERVDAEAGEQVEVFGPICVVEVAALAAHVEAVEADRLQHLRHQRVHVGAVKLEVLALAICQSTLQVERQPASFSDAPSERSSAGWGGARAAARDLRAVDRRANILRCGRRPITPGRPASHRPRRPAGSRRVAAAGRPGRPSSGRCSSPPPDLRLRRARLPRALPAGPWDAHQLCPATAATTPRWRRTSSGHRGRSSTGTIPSSRTTRTTPAGVNLRGQHDDAVPGDLLAPVTLTAGPIAAMNVLARLALAGAATTSFLTFRRWVRWTPAAAIGGLAVRLLALHVRPFLRPPQPDLRPPPPAAAAARRRGAPCASE